MKLSVAWIFDHIIGSWKEHSIPELVERFNTTTAEIEDYYKVTTDLHDYFLARVIDVQSDHVTVFIPELTQETNVSVRDDAQPGKLFMLKKNKGQFKWASLTDWASAKEGFIPAVSCHEDAVTGSWKEAFEVEDYILEIDNKTITHRPDLWGHRGVAREIAALLDIPFLAEDMLLAELPVKQYEFFASATATDPFSVEIKDSKACKRFATLYFPEVGFRSSWIWMAHRLARIDSRPIDAIVDSTNYVMFDWSQPIHAFDANRLKPKTIMPRFAKNREKLTLLDGDTIELSDQDLVITDGKISIALAGVMGGAQTGVSSQTNSLLVEAACFDATIVRRAALRHKKRTEASARFEKSLDPLQNTKALRRFLKLLDEEKMPLAVSDHIVSLGAQIEPTHIEVSHTFIEEKIGASIDSAFIIKTLSLLEFGIETQERADQLWYVITVPSFRATKDFVFPEDIVEEVARFWGFSRIPLVLPSIQMKPSSLQPVYKRRLIKQCGAYSLHAREVQNYALFDESFLTQLQWQPEHYVEIENPVSENLKRLGTSLIPHLIKNIDQNSAEFARLRFFEWNRCWQKQKDTVFEQKTFAGILYDQKQVDFYQEKESLTTIFNALHLPVTWHKAENNLQPWYHPYQTAELKYEDQSLGFAGKINQAFLSKVVEGDAFIFELDGDALLSLIPPQEKFEPLPKYPGTNFDVSMLIPLSVTVEQITQQIKKADGRIITTSLIDFFQKEDWVDQRSITMRIFARDPEKTLTKDDIDHIYSHVTISLKDLNATIR